VRLLADENVPALDIALLRRAGQDVPAVADDSPGASDRQVLDRARAEQRIILTLDLDFGSLVFRSGPAQPPGVILVREHPDARGELGELLVELLGRNDLSFEQWFAVVDRDRIRQRRLSGRG
jgi:predicted nuclease of predicted toxin-antitoxin system